MSPGYTDSPGSHHLYPVANSFGPVPECLGEVDNALGKGPKLGAIREEHQHHDNKQHRNLLVIR